METTRKIQINYLDANNHAKTLTIPHINTTITADQAREFGRKTNAFLYATTYVSTSIIDTTKVD